MIFRMFDSKLTILSIIATLAVFRPVDGQFPKSCTTVDALESLTCCPVNRYTGQECGGATRGQCVYHTSEEGLEHCDSCTNAPAYGLDDRLVWPMEYFDTWCECEWPFAGSACDKCAWGYYGDECDTYRLATRVNVHHPHNREVLERTVLYLDWMKTNITEDFTIATCTKSAMTSEEGKVQPCFKEVSYYNYIVWIHWYAAAYYNSTITNEFNHFSSGFIPWHRYFMLQWERFLQEVGGDPGYTLPYWKWIGDDNCTICTEELFGVTDDGGFITEGSHHFKNWETLCEGHDYIDDGRLCDPDTNKYSLSRHPGDGPIKHLPSDIKLEWTLTWPEYDRYPYTGDSNSTFRNALSGVMDAFNGMRLLDSVDMHLAGHYFMNGSMTPRSTSPNDPVFSVFHAFVDMIFETWYIIWGPPGLSSYPITGAPFGHCRDDYMVGVFPPQTNGQYLVQSSELNYVYEPYDSAPVPSPW